MPDLPVPAGLDTLVSCQNFGADTLAGQLLLALHASCTSAVWSTANTAVYSPITVQAPFLAQKIGISVGTQSGNLDVGLYTEQGVRLVSMGSTAVGAAGMQVLDIADTWLNAGSYFLAMNCDNVTAAFLQQTQQPLFRVCGILQQAVGAVALPATATFANYASKRVPLM